MPRVMTSEQAPVVDAPLFRRVMGRFAETVATHECGDHTVFVGHILTMSSDDSPPLVYHAGTFGALASGA